MLIKFSKIFAAPILRNPLSRHYTTTVKELSNDIDNSKSNSNKLTVFFTLKDNTKKSFKTEEGLTILELAHKNNIELEGACEGGLACSTCHGIIDPEYYNKFDPPSEREEDILCQAPGLTDTSRLCCQLKLKKEHDGINITLPKITKNFFVDNYVTKPH